MSGTIAEIEMAVRDGRERPLSPQTIVLRNHLERFAKRRLGVVNGCSGISKSGETGTG